MLIYLLLFVNLAYASSCKTYTIKSGDICFNIAQDNKISSTDLDNYNKKTLGWFGCDSLQVGQVICVSSGDPPKSDMECSKYISCPINACCSKFGYCGISSEFCGSGCVSNCGLPTSPSGSSGNIVKAGYWLDDDYFNDDGTYDTIFYSFAEIFSDLKSITVNDNFDVFKNIVNSKKILSIGGWDFSTSSSTYNIMRNAIKSENRPSVGKVISDFVKNNNLKGVNFDWEYPGEPDIAGIPAGSDDDGPNYSGLVQTVKNNLGNGYEVSVAIPASFWYLKHFPLSTMKSYIDYFVFMNYDYSGQWDYGKANTGIGCHVDQTKTVEAFKMLNKAGVPMSKVYGGLASYGRSYELSNKDCTKYMCGFTGPSSNALSRSLSKTPGILYENEIDEFNRGTFNASSKCFYTTYNNGKDWVAWMKESDRNYLTDLYKTYGVAGTALWAINYNSDYINDDQDDDDEEDFNSDYYFDPYGCSSSFSNNLGCLFDKTNDFIINNVTSSINIINNILDDYDNYLKYYDAYVRAYYDSIMSKYEVWYLHENGKDFYTKEDEKDIDIAPAGQKKKRQYDFLSMFDNKTEIIEMMENLNVTQIRIDYDPEYSIRVKLVNGTLKPDLGRMAPPPSAYIGTCLDMVILDSDKQNAIDSFNKYAGTSFGTDVFVQRSEDKYFEDPMVQYKSYNFHECTILDSFKLFPNILTNVTRDDVNNIQNIIETAKDSMFTEFGSDIYETLELTLIYSEIADIAQITYNDGKEQLAAYKKEKELLIVEIIFGIIGIGTLFLSPALSAISDIALLISVSAITGDFDPETLILSLFGIFSPILNEVNLGTKFAKIFRSLEGGKSKNYSNLDKFKYINEIRKQLGKPTCS